MMGFIFKFQRKGFNHLTLLKYDMYLQFWLNIISWISFLSYNYSSASLLIFKPMNILDFILTRICVWIFGFILLETILRWRSFYLHSCIVIFIYTLRHSSILFHPFFFSFIHLNIFIYFYLLVSRHCSRC